VSAHSAGRISRRGVLGLLGAGVAGAAGGAAIGRADAGEGTNTSGSAARTGPVPFLGEHQAGIVTPAQDRLHFAAFDLSTTSRADLVDLMRVWTAAAARMTAGQDVGDGALPARAQTPPDDTGEALGLPPAQLTVSIGFGTALFAHPDAGDRFGLAGRRPAALADLPTFPGDALNPNRSGGDLCIQACADDPQVAVHAVRNLARLAHGVASVRYSQLGFGRTSSTSQSQDTPRNLMGFKDGTANLKLEDTSALTQHVWVQPADEQGAGRPWMTGGSYLVSRRIRMLIEPWDSTPLAEQERVIGRTKGSGAPIGQTAEFAALDLAEHTASGAPVIDPNAHVRLAHPSANGGASLLRRGYSFVDGTDNLGRLDAGLFFLAYQRDPRTAFTRINGQLSGKQGDALNEYIQHVGSGLWACPPGVRPGGWWGQELLA